MTPSSLRARKAYGTSSAHRDPRAREADVFHQVNAGLRAAVAAGGTHSVALTRALADNRRLWIMVVDLMRDPDNRLPVDLRARIVSIGMTVLRELDQDEPDIVFLTGINEQIAEGLSD